MPASELNRVMHDGCVFSLEHSGHMGGQRRIGLLWKSTLRSFHGHFDVKT